MLWHAHGNRLDAGRAADVGDTGHLGDMRDFFGRLDHPKAHGRGANIDEFHVREFRFQQVQRVDVDMVKLDPKPLDATGQAANGMKIIVFLPVGVGDVLATEGPAPRLAAVDACADRGGDVVIDQEAVATAEVAEQEVRVVVDAVIAGEQRRIDASFCHMAANAIKTTLHLGIRKGRHSFVAIAHIVLQTLTFHRILQRLSGPKLTRLLSIKPTLNGLVKRPFFKIA